MGNLPTPEDVAAMYIGARLAKVLAWAESEANGQSTSVLILRDRTQHGTFLGYGDLQHISHWLDLRLHGDNPQLNEIFDAIKQALEVNGYYEHLHRRAPGITLALMNDEFGPRIDFIAVV